MNAQDQPGINISRDTLDKEKLGVCDDM